MIGFVELVGDAVVYPSLFLYLQDCFKAVHVRVSYFLNRKTENICSEAIRDVSEYVIPESTNYAL